MKKKLQERINIQICQVVQKITAFCNVKDTNDLDKNVFGGVVEMKV